ncbi:MULTISPECIES: NAD-dependent succinate-semialdehyde dehydrogenase [unclassified Mesorhizobium]|uniref:NAD-dependent succinate-semialdehyde dehydrogenase n=1 Tax=unclassified Mesorhizobium TaxID=325217 RepID=UPI00112A9151|nr:MULTISPECIES: NAD-dependent succinate-semialdehyde dehydrogenase [unclassified Mesorhizobium]TPK50739.1 NAD-dependent succinate-semialdehyde dehydrogenase [Mesorhizobium sp. B2-5-2]TPL23942.1 NAD-dependent succinate-semialdehyde dehydrogenase [Mesorhizobium sp. B2-4-7]TPL26188.1 NAD-dependent succinate-semialdehyde dehydrogenase [Mesorhizobium sp. B2-4-9]TPL38760.1 NAD-dependent succinate-semialdehyde dehydrogenase [Mesorhizobium sp. B2-4-5]TPM73910.1 NAD-dependent succinate-semialdehyde de
MSAHFARSHRHEALDRLADRRLLRELAYVDGHWTASEAAESFEVTDPATGATVAFVAALDGRQTASAIDAAARAFPAWRALLPQERSKILRKWFDLIIAAKDDLALLMTLEQGKPLKESLGEIDYAASFVEWYAEEAKRLNAESVTSHLAKAEMTVRREPLGVVGVVTPWNFPSAMLTRKAAAALAAGCTIVAHPSSETPLSALALAELGERAGLPAGVFNVVTGKASIIVGRMCEDPRVRAMSFTGSTEIGRLIAAQSAPTMKRLVMELGGHAPLIVFADADLDKAVRIAVDAKFATSGQDCLAANRIYVQRPIYDRFCAAFAKRIEALRTGNGLADESDIGPLMHERAVKKVEEQVTDALAHGARCLVGGRRHQAGPLFYQPTLLADVSDEALIMREETFGPVAAVTPFDSEDEVTARANASEYGLVAYVVTENGARQQRLGRALDYGMVAINRVKITGAPIPFGGVKQSGIGREGSRQGLEAFTDLKYLCLDVA